MAHGCKFLLVRVFIGSIVTNLKKESSLEAQNFLWSKNIVVAVFEIRKLTLSLFFERSLLAWMQHPFAS